MGPFVPAIWQDNRSITQKPQHSPKKVSDRLRSWVTGWHSVFSSILLGKINKNISGTLKLELRKVLFKNIFAGGKLLFCTESTWFPLQLLQLNFVFYGIEYYTLSNSKQQGGFSLSGLNSRFDKMFATDQTSDHLLTGNERNYNTRQHLCFIVINVDNPNQISRYGFTEDIKYKIN